MSIDYNVIQYAFPILIKGLFWTISISVISILISFGLGLALCLGKINKHCIISWIFSIVIEMFRGTPFLIQLFIIYYVLPSIGIKIPTLTTGILALTFHTSAYMAEVYRSGLNSLPKGQGESARALGISYYDTIFNILIPQIGKLVIPSMTNLCISTVKNSSMLSIITIAELTFKGQAVMGDTFAPFEVYFLTAILYWIVNAIISQMGKFMERKVLA